MQNVLDTLDLKRLSTLAITFLPKALVAILLLLGFWLLYRISRRPLRAVMRGAKMEAELIDLLVDSLYRYAIWIIALVMAADQLGINVAAALAGIGIAGIALGFAAQDSVANVISGIIIFWDKPFVVGDWVRTPDFFGRVTTITLRSTRIRTTRNTFVVIPNKTIVDAVLENLSKHGELRVDVPVGIAYKEDIGAARDALLAAVRKIETVKADPPPDVITEGLGDSSVNLRVRVWIDNANQHQPVSYDVVEAAKRALDEAGIEIPFPHLQLFVEDVDARVWEQAARLRPASGER